MLCKREFALAGILTPQRCEPLCKADVVEESEERALRCGIAGRKMHAPVRMAPGQLHGSARLRAGLLDQPRNVGAARRGLEVKRQRIFIEHAARPDRAQTHAKLDVFPAVFGERFIEKRADHI